MPTFLDQIGAPAVEHGDTRLSRWLRARWVSLGAGIALAEGILVIADTIPKWVALVAALALLFGYFSMNRSSLSPELRIGARIVALSQLLVLFVPVLLLVLETAAIIAL